MLGEEGERKGRRERKRIKLRVKRGLDERRREGNLQEGDSKTCAYKNIWKCKQMKV